MRLKYTKNILLCILALLTLRTGYICIFKHNEYIKITNEGRFVSANYPSDRKNIYDRKMIKLTNRKNKPVYINGRKLNIKDRYCDDGFLCHVIGYNNETTGVGIEKAFKDELLNNNDTMLVKDAFGKPVGFSKKQIKKDYSGIMLTIDYHIQKICEEALKNSKMKGSIIVVDNTSGEILAMASAPVYNQNKIEAYMSSSNGELLNRAIAPYNLGSLFKIIISAIALEENISEEDTVLCTGKTEINGTIFTCNKEDGHGKVNLKTAFAQSCNCYFYEIGQRLGSKKIIEYAKKFGFGEKVLKMNNMDENKGYLPPFSDSKGDTANLSIGQGTLLATPLQMADCICTVANNGIRKQLMLIKGYVNQQGESVCINPSELERTISAKTSALLKEFMKETVTCGTGTKAQSEYFASGGKTSSAESGWETNGETMTHAWFAGFFPYETSKYSAVIFIENGKSGGDTAGPLFRYISENIMGMNAY